MKECLNIFQVLTKPTLNFDNLKQGGKETEILDELSLHLGSSLRVMGPPTSCCLLCKKMLSFHHKPTQIVVHTLTGPYLYSKYIFRCRGCRFASNHNGAFQSQPQDIHYHPDRYGNDKMGWKFYGHLEFRHVRASNEVFIEKDLVEDYLALLHHGWLSSEGKCEAYNELYRDSKQVHRIAEFLRKNNQVGHHFDQHMKCSSSDEVNQPHTDVGGVSDNKSCTFTGMHELHRKSLTSAVYNHEIYNELTERGKISVTLFGPMISHQNVRISYKESVECLLGKGDQWRTAEIYEHLSCSGVPMPSLIKSKNHLFSIRIMSKKGMFTSVECRWSLETVLSHLVRMFCFMT